jgi:endogenous inhibitor of DNA gyrase (YacG/DUF329 family)
MIIDVNCPYCGHPQDINHDDGYGYSESEIHNQYCGQCDKTFSFTTTISFSYEVNKADCLNGDEHKYEPTHTFPKYFTKMQCPDCGETRELTQDERKEMDIETYNP